MLGTTLRRLQPAKKCVSLAHLTANIFAKPLRSTKTPQLYGIVAPGYDMCPHAVPLPSAYIKAPVLFVYGNLVKCILRCRLHPGEHDQCRRGWESPFCGERRSTVGVEALDQSVAFELSEMCELPQSLHIHWVAHGSSSQEASNSCCVSVLHRSLHRRHGMSGRWAQRQEIGTS